MNIPQGQAARSVALDLLAGALSRRGGLEAALTQPSLLRLPPRDRAFARALVMAALRHLGPIDRALAARLVHPPPGRVHDVLRLGAAQAFHLDTPDFAAVATSVDLAPARFKALVNAVMRGVIAAGPPPESAETLAPAWLFARWRAAFGADTAGAIALKIGEEPASDLSPREPPTPELVAALQAEVLAGGSLRTGRRGDPSTWPGYEEGAWWMQDAAAAVPARLLRARKDEAVLDLCAAPGGKTLQLAAAGARVTAVDRSASRLRQVAANLKRTGLSAEAVAADVAAWTDPRRFDAVLLDAPCLATGTFRRHPDVLWNARPGEIGPLAAAQAALLDAAAERLRSGGRLVYSVCSLEPEEGEDQIAAFLARRSDIAIDSIAEGEAGAPVASLAPRGWLRILPHHLEGGVDGFFVARMRRV